MGKIDLYNYPKRLETALENVRADGLMNKLTWLIFTF